MIRRAVLLATLVATAAAAEPVRFVACPVYRDTDAGRKSGCWLADDPASGTRYDVTWAASKPDWNYAVLVEGIVSPKQDDACGGVVLDAVRASILFDERCPHHILPAEQYKGRRFVLPRRNIAPLSVKREAPKGPFAATTFYQFYDLNRDQMVYQYNDYLLDEAIQWMRAAKPTRITVTGWAATQPFTVSGRRFAEPLDIAKSRAELTTLSLVRMGFDPKTITTRWRGDSQPTDAVDADGLTEASRRRVEIRAEFDR